MRHESEGEKNNKTKKNGHGGTERETTGLVDSASRMICGCVCHTSLFSAKYSVSVFTLTLGLLPLGRSSAESGRSPSDPAAALGTASFEIFNCRKESVRKSSLLFSPTNGSRGNRQPTNSSERQCWRCTCRHDCSVSTQLWKATVGVSGVP